MIDGGEVGQLPGPGPLLEVGLDQLHHDADHQGGDHSDQDGDKAIRHSAYQAPCGHLDQDLVPKAEVMVVHAPMVLRGPCRHGVGPILTKEVSHAKSCRL